MKVCEVVTDVGRLNDEYMITIYVHLSCNVNSLLAPMYCKWLHTGVPQTLMDSDCISWLGKQLIIFNAE